MTGGRRTMTLNMERLSPDLRLITLLSLTPTLMVLRLERMLHEAGVGCVHYVGPDDGQGNKVASAMAVLDTRCTTTLPWPTEPWAWAKYKVGQHDVYHMRWCGLYDFAPGVRAHLQSLAGKAPGLLVIADSSFTSHDYYY